MGELAQTTVTFEGSGLAWGMFFLWFLVFYAIAVIPYWVIFTKAGMPGGRADPIYSTFVLEGRVAGVGYCCSSYPFSVS
jgi:hypothetical protein